MFTPFYNRPKKVKVTRIEPIPVWYTNPKGRRLRAYLYQSKGDTATIRVHNDYMLVLASTLDKDGTDD